MALNKMVTFEVSDMTCQCSSRWSHSFCPVWACLTISVAQNVWDLISQTTYWTKMLLQVLSLTRDIWPCLHSPEDDLANMHPFLCFLRILVLFSRRKMRAAASFQSRSFNKGSAVLNGSSQTWLVEWDNSNSQSERCQSERAMNNESEAGVRSVAPFCPLSTIEKTNTDLLTIILL